MIRMITSFKTIKLFALTLLIAGLCVQTAFTLTANESMELTTAEMDFIDVTGTVTDDNGDGLIGATILEKGTGNGTITDLNGNFSITVGDDATLVISYTGFVTQEIAVSNQTVIAVTMATDVARLSEVVVTGYSTQRKANLTGSVGVVSAAELEGRTFTNASQVLHGKISGVWINQNSGEPGDDATTIRIRGIGTLNDPNPLILVDGIEAPFNNVDPNDIESVTVLKDAASAAIYGSRAANGVILITTKRGSTDGKVTFSYTGYMGTSKTTNIPEFITNSVDYMTLTNEANFNTGNPIVQGVFGYSEDFINSRTWPNTDWYDLVLKNGPIQQHSLSIGGGSDNTNFYISLGYLDQTSIVVNTEGTKRYNARLNLDTRVNDQFKIGGSFYVSRQNTELDNISEGGGFHGRLTRTPPNYPPFTADGRFADRDVELDKWEFSNPNVIAELLASTRFHDDSRFLGSFYADYEPIEGLNIRGTFAANYQVDDDTRFNGTIQTYRWDTGEPGQAWSPTRSIENRHRERLNLTSWVQATYEKTINVDHNFKFLVGANQESADDKFFAASRLQLPSNSLPALNVGNPATSTNRGSASEWALRSFFGRVNYDYKNKYLFEANVRRDGSSRFGSNNRWANFPSFSAGWVISEEPFFNSSFIDFFKIRGSWGQLGNQNIGNYPFAATISFAPATSFGGTIVGGAAQTTLGNPNIRWEETTQTDIGINLSLLDGGLSIEADYFVRTANDILFDQNNPAVTGVRTPTTVNIARVRNEGWELGLNYRQKIGKGTLSFGGNVTHIDNEVLQINPDLIGEADRIIQGRHILQRGAPINALFGLNALEIFQTQAEVDAAPSQAAFGGATPGDIRYEDLNGDGVVDFTDRTVIGKDNPTWLFGVDIAYEIGGFDIAALFQGVADVEQFENQRVFTPFNQQGPAHVMWYDRWTPENPSTTLPKLRIGDDASINYNVRHSWWLTDRSYLRLKNLQIGYNVPSSAFENNFIQSLRFFVNGTNLWTLTDYVGFDPEAPERTDSAIATWPQLKTFTGGVTLKF